MEIDKFGQRSHITWTAEDLRKEREADIQMREIKFRVWDKKEKKMYDQQDKYTCGLVILLDGLTKYGGCLDYSSEPEFDSFQWYNKEIVEKRYVLMQFTGLKDKNGKEIYEGDIVKGTWLTDHKTVCTGTVKYWKKYGLYGLDEKASLVSVVWNSCEVIGNIHQNPELMEQENG